MKEEDFSAVLRALPRLGCLGVNVTIPHKEAAYALVDTCDPLAARIGAVNTVVIEKDGMLHGANTDIYGFKTNLEQAGYDMKSGAALVLGAGGAARAVLASLQQENCPRIFLANRTPERAAALAAHFGDPVTALPWEERETHLGAIKLVVNTTSLGLDGADDVPLDLSALPGEAAVCDLVYRPLETGLLRRARSRGLRAVDGLGMLLGQAQESFRLWFGFAPDVTPELRRHVLEQ